METNSDMIIKVEINFGTEMLTRRGFQRYDIPVPNSPAS